MRKLFELVGSIGLMGYEPTKKEISEVNKEAKKLSREFLAAERHSVKLGKSLSAGLTAPIVALGAGMAALVIKTGEYAEKLNNLEQTTGLTTDTLQEMEHVAGVMGVPFETFVGAISKLTNSLPEIIEGTGPASDAIKRMGVSVQNADGSIKNMNDLFPELIHKLQGVENIAERNALAQDIFGRSLESLGPILGMTQAQFEGMRKEAHEMGLVMDGEAIDAADSLGDQIDNLKQIFVKIGLELGSKLVPLFRDVLVPVFTEKVLPAVRWVAEAIGNLSEWFNKLSPGMKSTVLSMAGIAAAIGPVLIITGKLAGAFGGLIPLFAKLIIGQMGFNAALTANPIGLVVVAVAALVAGGIALYNMYKKNNEELERAAENTSRELSQLVQLKNEYDNLRGKAKLTVEEKERLKTVTDELIKLAPNSISYIDQETGQIILLNEELEKEITKKRILVQEAKFAEKEADYQTYLKNVEAAEKYAESIKRLEQRIASLSTETNIYKMKVEQGNEMSKHEQRVNADNLELIKQTIGEKTELETKYNDATKSVQKYTAATLEGDQAIYNEGETTKNTTVLLKQKSKAEEDAAKAKLKAIAEAKKASEEGRKLNQEQFESFNESTKEEMRLSEEAAQNQIDAIFKKEEFKKQEDDANKKKIEDEKQRNIDRVAFIGSASDQAFGILSQFNQNEMALIDNKAAREKEAILNSVMSEEEKAAAIENIEAKAEVQKRKLRQQAAKQEKAAAIVSVIINTAQAVMKGFAQLGPIFGAIAQGVTMALGAAQIAAIAAQPLPMAEGGVVEGNKGGIVAQVGEGAQSEIVMPLETGIRDIVAGVIDGMSGAVLPPGRSPMAGVDSPQRPAHSTTVNINVGTMIADDYSRKKFVREIIPIFNAEARRKGQME